MTPVATVPEAIAGFATRRALAQGEPVFRAQAAARHVYFLLHGRVVMQRFGPAGEEVIIHVAQPGEFFAEASLHSERYHCSAIATVAGEVACLAAAELRLRLQAEPAFAMQWLALVSGQLRRTRARVERLSLKGAVQRVRHLLVTEGRGTQPAYLLRGSVKQLAGELGLTHEALYRALAAMRREGQLAREGDTLVLLR